MARAAFNRALATRDLPAIGTLLAEQVVLITGSDSALISGRKAQMQAWKREFAASPITTYVRLPTTITLSPVEPIALEHGTWHGTHEGETAPWASGSYAAKWRRLGDRWLIEGELYVTLG